MRQPIEQGHSLFQTSPIVRSCCHLVGHLQRCASRADLVNRSLCPIQVPKPPREQHESYALIAYDFGPLQSRNADVYLERFVICRDRKPAILRINKCGAAALGLRSGASFESRDNGAAERRGGGDLSDRARVACG